MSTIEKVAVVLNWDTALWKMLSSTKLLKTLLVNLVEGIIDNIELIEPCISLCSWPLQELPAARFYLLLFFNFRYIILLYLFLLRWLLLDGLYLYWFLKLLKLTRTVLIWIRSITKYGWDLCGSDLDIVVASLENVTNLISLNMWVQPAQIFNFSSVFSCTPFFRAQSSTDSLRIGVVIPFLVLLLSIHGFFLAFRQFFLVVLWLHFISDSIKIIFFH